MVNQIFTPERVRQSRQALKDFAEAHRLTFQQVWGMVSQKSNIVIYGEVEGNRRVESFFQWMGVFGTNGYNSRIELALKNPPTGLRQFVLVTNDTGSDAIQTRGSSSELAAPLIEAGIAQRLDTVTPHSQWVRLTVNRKWITFQSQYQSVYTLETLEEIFSILEACVAILEE